jgi:phage head maturation protease
MKNLMLICEAKVNLGANENESENPSGLMEARVTTWGAREGADGRKFNYQPEGFFEWASGFREAGKPLPMFLNHNDMGMPVGEWYEFDFDKEGMTAKGKLFMNTNAGADLYNVLKESPNLFGGVSVGAYAEEACWVDAEGEPLMPGTDGSIYSNPKWETDDAYFQITKGGLREVSVVMYPNNPNAEIHKLEAFDIEGQPNPRVIEKVLREAGLSRKDATTASSILKKLMESRDAKPATIQETPSSSESDAVDQEAELLRAFEIRELELALSKRI